MRTICFFLFSFLFMGCASIFEGYMSDVEIKNAPDSLKVYSSEGMEIRSNYKIIGTVSHNQIWVDKTDSTTQIIQLRSNRDHLLILKSGSVEHRHMVYAKVNPWWFILDSFGILPLIYDAVTGNWNYFNDVEYKQL